jgi:hypothetical protein
MQEHLNSLDGIISGKKLSKKIQQQVEHCRQRMEQVFPETFAVMVKYPNFYNHPTIVEADEVNDLFCKIQQSLTYT